MNNEQLARAKEIKEEIHKIGELLNRVNLANSPEIKFNNDSNAYGDATKKMYLEYVDQTALGVIERLAGDFIINSLNKRLADLQNEFENL